MMGGSPNVRPFDEDTGAVVWRTAGTFTYSSPLIVELDGVRHVVSVSQDHVVGLSAHDGVLLWAHPFASPYLHAITPIEHAGRIIVSAQNMGVRALRPRRERSGWTVETAWRNDDVSTAMANPVVVADTLFGLRAQERAVLHARCEHRHDTVAGTAASGREHGHRRVGATALSAQRRRRVDRGARQPRRLRAARTLYRGRQCHVGPTGHLRQPVLRQGRGHADSMDDVTCALTA